MYIILQYLIWFLLSISFRKKMFLENIYMSFGCFSPFNDSTETKWVEMDEAGLGGRDKMFINLYYDSLQVVHLFLLQPFSSWKGWDIGNQNWQKTRKGTQDETSREPFVTYWDNCMSEVNMITFLFLLWASFVLFLSFSQTILLSHSEASPHTEVQHLS